MRIAQIIVLLAILVVLCSIRISLEKLAVNVLEPARITEVRHVYNYRVDSYGTIRLNDKLVNVVKK